MGNSEGKVSRALKKPPSLNSQVISAAQGGRYKVGIHTRACPVVWVVTSIVSSGSGDLAWDTPDDHDFPLVNIIIVNKPFDANSVRVPLKIDAVKGQ